MCSTPPTLSDMPFLLLNKIFSKTDFESIQKLRKTCRSFRRFIDDEKPEGNLKDISVYLEETTIFIVYESADNQWSVSYEADEDGKVIETCQNSEGEKGVFVHLEDGETELSIAMKDLQLILNNRKQPLNLLNVFNQTGITADYQRVLEKLNEMLRSNGRRLPVESLLIDARSEKQILLVLLNLDPAFLKSIESHYYGRKQRPLVIKKLKTLEHWKNAEKLTLSSECNTVNFQDILHFSSCDICLESVVIGDLMQLKTIFLSSESKDTFTFKYTYFEQMPRFIELMGPEFRQPMASVQWWFRYANRDKVLSVLLDKSARQITFKRSETTDVPEEGVIQE